MINEKEVNRKTRDLNSGWLDIIKRKTQNWLSWRLQLESGRCSIKNGFISFLNNITMWKRISYIFYMGMSPDIPHRAICYSSNKLSKMSFVYAYDMIDSLTQTCTTSTNTMLNNISFFGLPLAFSFLIGFPFWTFILLWIRILLLWTKIQMCVYNPILKMYMSLLGGIKRFDVRLFFFMKYTNAKHEL